MPPFQNEYRRKKYLKLNKSRWWSMNKKVLILNNNPLVMYNVKKVVY